MINTSKVFKPRSYLGGEIRVERGYVLVTSRVVDSVARAEEIVAAVDLALQEHELRLVLIDSREVEEPPEETNVVFRAWVDGCAHHDKVAVLLRSDLKRIASNMRALSVRVRMRSFHELTEALTWLHQPLPRTRSVA